MRIVEDEYGRRYLLRKRSAESSLVRDLVTGESRFLPNEQLSERAGIDPLEAAGAALSGAARDRFSGVHDERTLGLLVLLARDPRPVRTLLESTDLCESDLLGIATELRAAGLVEEATVGGERGYAATEAGREAVAATEATATDDRQSAGASSSESSD